ncbi:MAG: ArsR/SmtB family transcription factor [Opitutales bacterium]
MELLSVYRCLCDETRLRILNLLLDGPLCVCHLAAVLELEQPKISRHLKALRESGAVATERCYNWTIYRLADAPSAALEMNLKCLQDLRGEEPLFQADLLRRAEVVAEIATCGVSEIPTQIRELCGPSCGC